MRVLIADDELPIREWLRMMMESAQEGIEVWTAGNGKEAWDIFQEKQPELVVTDIKMPRMTGLELLQRIKEVSEKTYVVMLTAYGEFEYAREAIKYQANEYILKNEISRESLTELLKNYFLCSERQAGETVSLEELLERGELSAFLENEMESQSFFAVAFPEEDCGTEELETYLNQSIIKIRKYTYAKGIAMWLCACHTGLSESALFYEAMAFCKKLSGLKEVSVGFSGFGGSMTERCLHARRALNLRFYERHQGVYVWEPEKEQKRDEILAERKRIVALLNQKRMEEAAARMEALYEKVEKARITELEFIENCFCDIVDACKIVCMEQAGKEFGSLCRSTKEQLRCAEDLEQVMDIFTGLFAKTDGAMTEAGGTYGKYIQSALAYIADHYGTIESLTEVAAYVHLNTEYFCRVFKAETGVTFNTYLTEYRIKKAVELLENSDMKVYEVAERVGYANLSYFSKVFKKVTGETPFALKNDIKSR